MAGDGEPTFDHVVAVMFENRTFDNLLGRLYQPGEVAAFEGVIGKDLANPIPEWAEHGSHRGVVPYGIAAGMDTPNPDPGEEFSSSDWRPRAFPGGCTWTRGRACR
jgi:phospholipase C